MNRTALLKSPRCLLFMCATFAACSGSKPQAPADARRPAPAAPQLMIGQLPDIDVAAVLAQTKVLSSDQFEGRAPGTPGEEKSVAFLVDQFSKGSENQTLKWKDDVVAWTKHVANTASIASSELVFVGYGVVAPEFNWDDYKGVDVTGKTLVMLVNDPPVPDPANAGELDA